MSYAQRHAELYDHLYAWKDYEAEAHRLIALLSAEGLDPDARVLEAACGTGAWLEALMPTYEVAGFDLEPAMVRLARRRLPGVPVFIADMRSLEVEAPFDVWMCMFSSIGYLAPEQWPQALAAARAALRPGGFLVIEPWIQPEAFRPNTAHATRYSSPELCISRHALSRLEGRVSVLDFEFLVTTPEGHERFQETHRLHLMTLEEMRAALEAAGFAPRWHAEGLTGRGLWIARRD